MSQNPRSSSAAVELIDVFDASEIKGAFELLDQDVVPLPSTHSLKARQLTVRLDGASLVYYTTNVRVRTRPTLSPSLAAYISFAPGSAGTANGLPIRGDVILATPPSQTVAMVAEPGYESVSFLVPTEHLTAHLSAQGQHDVLYLPRRVEMRNVEPSAAGKLFEWGKRLVESALEQPALFNDSAEHRAAARQDMLEVLVSTLASSSPLELERRDRTRLMQSDIVRAAEQYALAHSSERMYVKDLCQAACVSERSLEYAFRAEMNLSPTAYLTRIRLHKVREALLHSAQKPTTVTNEALRWGFWHFGEFAKSYKECFQELPSDTLRRVQGH